MTQTAIPSEFEKYMQNQISVGKAPDMNEMIFAYIPGLDPSEPIDRAQGLPDVATWVYQQDIDQVGKVGDNALAYSVVVAGSVAAFTFNAIYLHDKNVPNSCGMVVHKADETKEDGSAVTKSLLQEYLGAAEIVGINVDASTWQIDFQARLIGIDEDHRLACLDNYGHTAFIEGFDVTQQADVTKYLIAAGVVYIGGLRAALADEVLQTIVDKPTGIYLDVYRDGTSTSKWENILTVRISDVELDDYLDGNKQHYVAKLATVNADGSVSDERVKGGLALHESVSQFMPYDPLRKYKCGEVCTTETDGELSYWQWYSNVETLAGKDPLDVANRHDNWADSTRPFYWIPYTGEQVGMPFFWLDTTPPEWAVMEVNADLPTAVYWRLARKYPHLVSGDVINTGEIRGEFLRVLDQSRGVDADRQLNSFAGDSIKQSGFNIRNDAGGSALVSLPDGEVSIVNTTGSITVSGSSTGQSQQRVQIGSGQETAPRSIARPMAIAI